MVIRSAAVVVAAAVAAAAAAAAVVVVVVAVAVAAATAAATATAGIREQIMRTIMAVLPSSLSCSCLFGVGNEEPATALFQQIVLSVHDAGTLCFTTSRSC